ncbi:GNAT family N-acetyltransferase [Agrococcus jejuensis]|uniref:Protein N-acetyltransferase, RimJ/RimL family n=1 Tax=Agrococcus jejuensis TaxID=399736 RepID=A0A1G8CP85_9MICO|nr:GNAT family protein [Agrococcus jejuensis]SDH47164.1 Protein N-acetyltransferase, RimJ/RimL family [Agrococcus jejuensis]
MRSWPLFDLVLRTPRLELRPVRDDDLDDVVDAALSGIHEPDLHPFPNAWNVGTPDEVRRRVLQFQWRQRASVEPNDWVVQLGVRFEGRVVGVQDIGAKDLAVRRVVETGSWLRQDVQGRGIGTEMRAAALLFAFDVLGATVALSGYAEGNAASAGVSRRLGYVDNGRAPAAFGDRRIEEQRLRLDRDAFVRPDWALQVEGWDAARADLLGDDA